MSYKKRHKKHSLDNPFIAMQIGEMMTESYPELGKNKARLKGGLQSF